MRYRRARVNGGACFFSLNLAERRRFLLVEYIDVLRKVVGMVQERHHFAIDAMVILSEHLHVVWTLPQGTRTIPGGGCSSKPDYRGLSPQGNAGAPVGRARENAASGTPVSGTPHPRRSGLCQTCGYIHYNPVKQGHVPRAVDWAYSSSHRHVEAGMIDRDWGAGYLRKR
jgi:putative transposase